MIRKIKGYTEPYPECETCKTLADCPRPDVEDNGMGSPMPPEVCPQPIQVMKATLKNKKENG